MGKGKQRAVDADLASGISKASSQAQSGAVDRRSASNAGYSNTYATASGNPSSSSSTRNRNLSPHPSDSELEDSELEHESEDEFERYRNGAAPSYAQYLGDSDLDEQAGDSSDDDDQEGSVDASDAGSLQGDGEDEPDYLDGVQAGRCTHITAVDGRDVLNRLNP